MNEYGNLSEAELIERLQALMSTKDQNSNFSVQDFAERVRLIEALEMRSDDWLERLAALVRQKARDSEERRADA